MNEENIPFGLADITIDEGGTNEVKFDGVSNFQMEGGELTFSPILQDIMIGDFGESIYDQRVTGYTGSVTLSGAEETIESLKLALSYTEDIVDATSTETVGVMDAKIGTSMRKKAKKIRIHPRSKADQSADIVIYKMASNGEYTRSYNNEQGSIPITFTMYPRDGMDASKPGNFFFVGPQDPNEVV